MPIADNTGKSGFVQPGVAGTPMPRLRATRRLAPGAIVPASAEGLPPMRNGLTRFLIHWAITSFALWAASRVFSGIRFADATALVVAALVLGFVNAIVRPILILLTLPLTVLTLGLFLFVINALMLMLVSALVSGFIVQGFGTALIASVFVSLLSLAVGSIVSIGARAD